MRWPLVARLIAVFICWSAASGAAQLRMDQLAPAVPPTDADIFEVEQGGALPLAAATFGQLRTYLSAVITGVTPSAVSFTAPAAPSTILASFAGVCPGRSCSSATFALGAQTGCAGTNNGLFVLSTLGILSVGNAALQAGTYTICEQLSLSGSQPFFVSVSVAGQSPLVLTLNPSSATEPCAVTAGSLVSTASTSGGDGNAVAYSMTGNTTDFIMNSTTGALTVAPGGVHSADCGNSYTNTIAATQP